MSTPMGCGGGLLHVILVVSIGVRGVVRLSIITTTSSGWEFVEYWLRHHKQKTCVLERISSLIYIEGKGNLSVEQPIGELDFSIYITANTLYCDLKRFELS
jgi:hypothetical protein